MSDLCSGIHISELVKGYFYMEEMMGKRNKKPTFDSWQEYFEYLEKLITEDYLVPICVSIITTVLTLMFVLIMSRL